jgi:hypothetical protein
MVNETTLSPKHILNNPSFLRLTQIKETPEDSQRSVERSAQRLTKHQREIRALMSKSDMDQISTTKDTASLNLIMRAIFAAPTSITPDVDTDYRWK